MGIRFLLLTFLFVFTISVAGYGDEVSSNMQDSSSAIVQAQPLEKVILNTDDLLQWRKTSFKNFPRSLGENFVSLFNSGNAGSFFIGAAAAGISTTFDQRIHNYFSDRNTSGEVGNLGATLGKPYVLVPTVGALLFFGHKSNDLKFRSFSYALSQGFVLNYGVTAGLKYATGRTRPDGSDQLSFPSGHASDAFMIATVVHQYYGRTAGIIGYGVAGFVSASRLTKDVHWLSDVVAGATLGYIVGRTVSHNTGGLDSRRFTFVPSVDPAGKGFGVNVFLQLP